MVNKKIVNFRIEPYIQEAILQIIVDILVILLISVVLFLARFSLFVYITIISFYFVIALVLHYRVVIQAIIDKRKKDYITETVSIKKFDDEFSFAGDRFGHSNIRFFYSKGMQVDKYKLNVISGNGEEKKLRTVMSFRRLLKFAVLDKHQIKEFQITYLKRSKILIYAEPAGGIDNISGKRKKEIQKAIHFINMSI